jgi:hypothetical protein
MTWFGHNRSFGITGASVHLQIGKQSFAVGLDIDRFPIRNGIIEPIAAALNNLPIGTVRLVIPMREKLARSDFVAF